MTPHVLIADDQTDNRKLLVDLLNASGIATLEAADGAEALAMAHQCDLVLLDVNMPRMDGFEVCRRLREDPKGRFLPILMVTALTSRADRHQGLAAGADDFLSKPIDRVELLVRVKSLLRIKAQRDEIERLKSEFTAMLVHDLRNPLSAIIGFGRLLESPLAPEQHAACTTHLIDAATRMQGLVDAILDLSALEAGTAQLDKVEVQPAALVQSAIQEVLPLAQTRGLLLTGTSAEGLPSCWGDDRKLRQILDNAIRFARTRVEVSAQMSGVAVEITVCNDGPAIPANEIPLLFEKWSQTSSGRRSGRGSGLGLAIARNLTEAHGGRISVQSESGHTCFRVELPVQGGSPLRK